MGVVTLNHMSVLMGIISLRLFNDMRILKIIVSHTLVEILLTDALDHFGRLFFG